MASSLDVGHRFMGFEVEHVVFDCSEKTLNNNIVNGSTSSVNRDLGATRL
jgi:hypothetical protein